MAARVIVTPPTFNPSDDEGSAEKRGQLIRCLEDALAFAEQLDDGTTEYLIERALDEARPRQFKPATDRN
jgi:hypothetical protein